MQIYRSDGVGAEALEARARVRSWTYSRIYRSSPPITDHHIFLSPKPVLILSYPSLQAGEEAVGPPRAPPSLTCPLTPLPDGMTPLAPLL